MTQNLYHASKTPGIKMLKPNPHNVVDDHAVVFATDDPLFAVAMSYGTGAELAVGYYVDIDTGEKQMYVDELELGKLQILSQKCSLYSVDSKYFQKDERTMDEEYISKVEVPVLEEVVIDNALKYLRSHHVQVSVWGDVVDTMEARGKEIDSPTKAHSEGRFKPVELDVLQE